MLTSFCRFRLVAAIILTLIFIVSFPPTRSISFSCKYFSSFQPLRAWPKGGGIVMNHNMCVTCHTHHTSVTDFRPKLGNPMEVTHMTSPKMYIVSHAEGTYFPQLQY